MREVMVVSCASCPPCPLSFCVYRKEPGITASFKIQLVIAWLYIIHQVILTLWYRGSQVPVPGVVSQLRAPRENV